ncbi:MAG: YfhO family protein [Taibaiella sp.]|nr:YfhO family protein [Taibaiella sp.]
MQFFDFKKIRIDLFIILGFAVLSLLFCYPQLQGKKLVQSDNIHWQGMAREAMAYHDSTGKDVLWTNSLFGGMPAYTIYIGARSTDYVAYIQNIIQAVGKPAYFFFLAMLGFFILSSVLKINRWLGVVGAVAYAFSTYNPVIIAVGHETKMLSIGYMPAVLAGFILLYRNKYLSGAALLAVSMALMVSNNHFQLLYYTLIMLFIAGIGMLIIAVKQGNIKSFIIASVLALITGGIGAATNMASILTTKEYAKETMRGGQSELAGHDKGKKNGGLDKEYAFRWSNGIGETFCFMIPYLYGGSDAEPADAAPKTAEMVGGDRSLPLYWGPQPLVSGPVYFGAIICFLFILSISVIRSPHKWWMLAVSALAIIMSWGNHFEAFNYFLFDNLPMLNKFRTPSMILVLPELIFPILGIWALNDFIELKDVENNGLWKKVKTSAIITGGLCLVLGLLGSMFFSYTGGADAQMQPELIKALKEDRSGLAMKSCLISAFYILLATGLLWAYLKSKIKKPVLIAGIGILVAFDLMSVASHYLDNSKYEDAADYETHFENEVAKRNAKQAYDVVLKDHDPYFRVLDISQGDPYDDAVQAYYFKCIGGYHPAKLEIYQDLIERQLGGKFNTQVLNMLNTKYFIIPQQNAPAGVIPNPTACGNAWFVNNIKWANTAEEEITSLNAPSLGDTTKVPGAFDAKSTAVIRTSFRSNLDGYNFGKDSAAYIKLAPGGYGLDDLTFNSSNTKDGFAVFSDIYYDKGWEAYVDGKQTPIVKANYVLRAIKVPEGQHKIEFHFRPKSYYTGSKIAMISSILVLGLCIGAIVQGIRKNKKTEQPTA